VGSGTIRTMPVPDPKRRGMVIAAAMGTVLLGVVGGAIFGGIIMHAYRSSGYPSVSIHRLTYAFTDFQHENRGLIVTGLVMSLIVAFVGVVWMAREARRFGRAAAEEKKP